VALSFGEKMNYWTNLSSQQSEEKDYLTGTYRDETIIVQIRIQIRKQRYLYHRGTWREHSIKRTTAKPIAY